MVINGLNLKAEQSELGKKSAYEATYNPKKLFAISRQPNRATIGITESDRLPFYGFDYWNHYEVSYLNSKGKPVVALAEIIYGCESLNIIESKSMKLYFNSLNNSSFDSLQSVETIIKRDLEERLSVPVIVRLIPLHQFKEEKLLAQFEGICIDELDIDSFGYTNAPTLLSTEEEWVEETLFSDLLKSNCLVTNQPDWCSIQISYEGKKINRENLLRYIVSFRNDNEFHEQCIEKVFMHIKDRCKPTKLTVYGRSTRRGGLDINSYRSTHPIKWERIPNVRLCRQ